MNLRIGRHRMAERGVEPAGYRVSHWDSGGFHITDPMAWPKVEGEFRGALDHFGWFAPKVWTERQWRERQAALAGKVAAA